MVRNLLATLVLAATYGIVACSSPSEAQSEVQSETAEQPSSEVDPAAALFPESLLKEFLTWNPVTEGDRAFPSEGHQGQTVRVYFNQLARPAYETQDIDSISFAPGSLIAKAVVEDSSTPATRARRVYFMRKMNPGYDPANNDWAYAFADRNGDKYTYNSRQGKVGLCITCHVAESKFDFVRTVEVFRKDRETSPVANLLQ